VIQSQRGIPQVDGPVAYDGVQRGGDEVVRRCGEDFAEEIRRHRVHVVGSLAKE